MAIPDSFLEELNARTDIVDLVSGYVALTKKGNRYWGLCPFHSEKTPSFSVNPERQMYYCFGCHKGGGAVQFTMELEGVSFRDAVGILAQRAGMQVPESQEDPNRKAKRERLYQLNRDTARWFHSNLLQPENAFALRYFTDRGLSRRTITNFGLGYAPNQWDGLIREMEQRGYGKQELLDAGLIINNDKGRFYDRFRGRVMFPIIDLRGNVIGFGGRVLDDSTPKYLNSPDTIIFNKSKNLFALNLARKSRRGMIILTEGYMDTIALHQAGFDCAVASLGTSLTEYHARMLAQRTSLVVISYDSDSAGVNAAQRAIGLLNQTGVQVKVLKVQGAKDPDEFIKKFGPDAFQKLIDGSESHIEFRLLQVKQKYDLTRDDQKVLCIQDLAQTIAALPGAAEREVYGTRMAQDLGVSAQTMQYEIEQTRRRAARNQERRRQRQVLQPVQQHQPEHRELRYENMASGKAEEGVIRLLLGDSNLLASTGGLAPEDFTVPLYRRVYEMLWERWDAQRSCDLNTMGELFSPQEMDQLVYIQQQPVSQANRERAMRDYVEKIQTQAMRRTLTDSTLMALRKQKNGTEEKP